MPNTDKAEGGLMVLFFGLVFSVDPLSPPKFFLQTPLSLMTRISGAGAGTIFGQGKSKKNGNAKLMGSLSNLDRVFVPEISVL